MTLGPQFEQLKMFHPAEGTGMADDPTNSARRQAHIDKMTGGVSSTASRVLMNSDVPLQHLRDVADMGTALRETKMANEGEYYASTDDGPGEMRIGNPDPITVVHEFGHALHDAHAYRYMQQRWGDAMQHRTMEGSGATNEGVATGYATRYSGERDNAYGDEMDKEDLYSKPLFRTAQRRVIESGQVPHTYNDQFADVSHVTPGRRWAALQDWMNATKRNRPNTQTETLF